MIILPTKGRPDSIKRFMASYVKTKASEPVILVMDDDDKSYDALELHPNFSVLRIPPEAGAVHCVNAAFYAHPNESYYGITADDVVPETPYWDRLLKEACLPFCIAWGNDGIPEMDLPTHPFFAGDLIRACGWLAYPGTKHWYADNITKDIANALGCGKFMNEIALPHYHVLNNMAELDDTYLSQPSRPDDQAAYLQFKEKDFVHLITRLKVEQAKYT